MFTGPVEKLRLNIPESEKGQDLAEYALLIGLIALLVIISLTLIGTNISEIFVVLAESIGVGL